MFFRNYIYNNPMMSTASSTMAAEWNITSMKKSTLNARGEPLLSPTNIPLDGIVAYDIEIETISSVNKKRRKNTMYGVPLFLVEAFTWLEKNKALDVEGIFRKPGSVKKLRHQWQVFCGLAPIPDWPDFSVHDVCTLIMRFFSVINKPILADQQNQILSTVAAIENVKVQVEAVFTFIDQLPPVNKATLGFLMRQLKKIADHPEHTQMSDANLAICFAPAIFNDYHSQEPRNYSLTAPLLSTSIWSNSSNSIVDGAAGRLVGRSLQTIGNCRKKKAGEALQQESLREIDFAKRRKDLQASVIKLLIQYADRICDGSYRLPATRVLHRKSSNLQFLRSPIAIASDQGQKTTNMKSRENEERKGRSRVPSFRSDKIWPRSASENPFNRIALFSFPFGKNGSFAPKESSTGKGQTHNTPKVQQSRPTIPFHSPSN